MRTWIMMAVLLMVTGCAGTERYPDECVQEKRYDNIGVVHFESYPCHRTVVKHRR